MGRSVERGRRWSAAVASLLLAVGMTVALAPPAAAATASMSITKTASTERVTPGVPFTYTVVFQCTAGEVDGCVNAQLVDQLPPGIELAGPPTLTGAATGTVTTGTDTVTVDFSDDLGVNGTGLRAGAEMTLTIPVVLDPDYPYSDPQSPLTNTATITADNADTTSANADVTPDVELQLDANTTKSIDPPGGLADPGTATTASLTGTSNSNAPVDTLVISDPVDPTADPNPFTYLNLSSIGAVTLPAGAETVQVRAFVGDAWVEGPVGPPAALPPAVDPADVRGLQFVFTSTTDPGIDPGSAAGVQLNLVQSPEVLALDPLPSTITNTADTTVSRSGQGATSDPADAGYQVLDPDIDVAAGKSFDPATVHAGDPSTVTVTGTNTSPALALDTLTVSDDPLPDGLTFTGLGTDGNGAGVIWPQGATEASILYSCAGVPAAEESTTTLNTLPAPPADCDPVTGFTVAFTGAIAPGAQATIPFGVVTDPDQAQEELTRTNTVDVAGTLGDLTPATNDATADITSIVDRLEIETGKTIVSPLNPLPSLPGQGVIVQLAGHVLPFPESTVDAHQIVVQDPDPLTGDEWFDAFAPAGVVTTPIPTDATLTVQYWDGSQWVDVPGMVDITEPNPFSGAFPSDVQQNAQGIRFVYTSTLPEPDGFAPGTTVTPNLGFTLRDGMAGSDATIGDCAGSSATAAATTATSEPACAELPLTPPDTGDVKPLDKVWDEPKAVGERSQALAGATISWSTAGYIGIGNVVISDTQDPDTTPLVASVFDTFDLARIDPITPALDPRLTFDQITGVELYRLPAGTTDPAAGSWQPAAGDPCPAACDGTFPGYTLTGDERATTIGFRLSYVESPTRESRITGPTDPPVGTGVAVSAGNNRTIHPVFQLRDELRSNPNIPVTADRTYNIAGGAGQVLNTVRGTGTFTNPEQEFTFTDSDTILITPVRVTAHADKSWTGGPLGIPEDGVRPEQYPTGRVTLTGQNTRPAKVDQLVITDPVTGTPNPFDAFDLAGFVSITDPASIGATDVQIVLERGPGNLQSYGRDEALALTADELAEVTGILVGYDGRIDANASAQIVFDTRLRAGTRSTGEPPAPGTTFTDTVGVAVTDLAHYPDVDPETATDAATAAIDVVAQGIDVTAGKSISPSSQTEPDNGPVTVTIGGQPSGASRTVQMELTDTSPTFWNQYDLVSLNPVGFTAPIDRVRVDAYTGGTWSVVGGQPTLTGGDWVTGSVTAGPDLTLPVDAALVQGLRYTFTRADGGNWENPANPNQSIGFTVQRRADLHTGGSVPSDLAGNAPAPGETVPGVATDASTATVTSSDVDAAGNPLVASDDATATILYRHARNAVAVDKQPNGATITPGNPFTYTLTVTNTGDVPIVDPVITDLLPTDGDGPQVQFPADGPAFTYSLAPAGTAAVPMPTDPADVTVVENPDRIEFTFPSGSTLEVGQTYTITFQMVVRPGLPADTAFTNTFGVTADRPWDTCAGSLDPDTGQCRDSATNTVLSAGALQVTKQVKAQGSDVLGVTLDPLATARECAADADGFYSRPCVPIAQPGGEITWRMHIQNVGNRPIDRVVAVDQLPAVGDTLATANLVRGSQWRPLLEGPRPTLATGSGVLTIWYTADPQPQCPTEIGTDGVSCPQLAWTEWPSGQTLPIDPDSVTGIKVVIDLDPVLGPTDAVDVDLLMTAPAFAPDPDEDPIAYNTVGTSGRWIQDAANGYTLTTEPPRVGVGLATGPLQVVKRVTGDAAGQYAPDSFTATLSCVSVGQPVPLPPEQANLTLTPDVPVLIENLPWGAECTVTDGENGQSSWTATTATVQRTVTDVEMVELTNDYEYASLSVRKDVDSDAVDAGGDPITYGPFTVAVSCAYLGSPVYADGYDADNPMTADLSDGQTVTFEQLPAGAQCSVTETDDHGAEATTIVTTAADGTAGEETLVLTPDTDDGNNAAVVTNTFGVGRLALVKVVAGDAAQTYGAGPFILHVTCELGDPTGDRTVWDGDVVLGPEPTPLSAEIAGIAAGSVCTVTETDGGGASGSSLDPADPVTINTGNAVVTVTVTNTFDPGEVVLTKAVTGDASAFAPSVFTVQVTCSADGAVLPGFPTTVEVTAGADTVVPSLVGASCTAVETGTGGATGVTYAPPAADGETGSGAVIVAPSGQEPITIGITNEYRAGGLQIAKEVDGPGASLATEPFVYDVSCAFNGDPAAFDTTVTLTPTGDGSPLTSEVIKPLPVGAVCTVTETDSGGADSVPAPVTVTIPDVDDDGVAQVVVAGFVNPFSAAQLKVTKVLAGTAASAHTADVFTLAVTCQYDLDGSIVTIYSGSVAVSGGQTVLVTGAGGDPLLLPPGAHCFASETGTGGADSSRVDYDSYGNAVIVEPGDELGTVTITAVNTFNSPPGPPTPPKPPVYPPAPYPGGGGTLPTTGFPLGQWVLLGFALLAAGAIAVSVTRRRRAG